MKEEKTGGFVLRVVILIAILILPAGCSRKAATADPVTATNTAGTSQAVFVQSSAAAETVTDDVEEVGAEETITEYYIGANFNGYAADDENYKLTRVDGYENVYSITVALTAENADQTYQAHYYKITNGTWTANSCWGMETYTLSEDKRPVQRGLPERGPGRDIYTGYHRRAVSHGRQGIDCIFQFGDQGDRRQLFLCNERDASGRIR